MSSLFRSCRWLPVAALPVLLAACESNPLLVQRSACPAVAVPAYAGDTTIFRPGSTAFSASDVELLATITNVRETCTETADRFVSSLAFDVVASRPEPGPARTVTLPYFVAIVQGGNLIDAKQLGQVSVSFAEGQLRGSGRATASASVDRTAASIPEDVLKRINKSRRPGELDAATDPMADPEVKAAMRAASFEILVGFQLDERGFAYNVTR